MSRNWREYCDDIIVWACGSFIRVCGNNSNGRYTGEELQGEWFPPASNDTRLINTEEGRIEPGGNNDNRSESNEIRVMTENRCSDPKIVEANSPISETNAVCNASASAERRSPIEWHDDIDV